jgi:glycosyltransferase involved in cell wall biosynthesis
MSSNKLGISILITSYNTPRNYLIECIKSILDQTCINKYRFEIVWINDGSNEEYTLLLEKSLELFHTIATINLIYKKLDENKGIVDALNIGLDLCTNELIFRMDSDDIMYPTRIQKQIDFMGEHPQCMILGTQIQTFKIVDDKIYMDPYVNTHQSIISWNTFIKNPINWFMNHPTLCYRKHAVEEIGKYSRDIKIKSSTMEDWELELRFLKKFGNVYNLQEPLLYYRIHNNSITMKNYRMNNINMNDVRKYIIQNLINND